MIHYNPVSGPGQDGFRSCVDSLQNNYGAQPAGLTVALFNNTTSSRGTRFPPTMYKTHIVTGFLTSAFGAAHQTMTATHYLFDGTIGLMDAGGTVSGCSGSIIQGGAPTK
jgi:hypothetical protein